MIKGLKSYNSKDNVFTSAFFLQATLAGGLTYFWSVANSKYNFLRCNTLSTRVLPAVFVAGFLYSRGVSLNYLAIRKNLKDGQELRTKNLQELYAKL